MTLTRNNAARVRLHGEALLAHSHHTRGRSHDNTQPGRLPFAARHCGICGRWAVCSFIWRS